MESREFSVKPAIERAPFQDKPTQAFFSKWCEVNDSIEPKYVSRKEWNKQKEKGMLQKAPDGKKSTLFIPEDLKLWEMIDVVEEIDKDTFAHDPSKRKDKRQELRDLGESFINAGIYVAQNLDQVEEGQKEAKETAKEFYRYGNKLQDGNYNEEVAVEDIAASSLSPKQTEAIDEWFGVDKLSKFKGEEPGKARKDMLKQFFKVTEKAAESEPHRKAIEKSYRKHLEKPINKPEQEMQDAIFRRGMEKVLHQMGKEGWKDIVVERFKTIGMDLQGQEKNLREILEIPRLKTELALAREIKDAARISEKEREVALKIQEAVTRLPYPRIDEDADPEGAFPAKIVENQAIICLGATLVGGALLREAGINYVVAGTKNHSFTLLITDDERVFYQDFTPPRPEDTTPIHESNFEIQDKMISSLQEGKQVTTKDIVAYSHSSENSGLRFGTLMQEPTVVEILRPDIGEQTSVMNNFGAFLAASGQREVAVEFYKRAIAIDKNDINAYGNLARAYKKLGANKEAIDMYKKAVSLDPFDVDQLNGLSHTLYLEGDYDESAKYASIAIEMNPEEIESYLGLGYIRDKQNRYKEAIDAFKKAAILDLKDSFAQRGLGMSLRKADRKEEAVDAFKNAVALDPEDDFALFHLGECLADLGRKEDALDSFKKIIEIAEAKGGIYPYADLAMEEALKLIAKES